MRAPLSALLLGLLLPGCSFDPSPLDPISDGGAGRPDARAPTDGGPPAVDAAPAPWWNDDFAYRVRISISEPPTDEELRDVPVLVTLDGERLDYARALPGGEDLRFIDDTGNEMKHEIERWNPDGRSFAWVRVPEIAAGRPTDFWLYYGNAGAASTADGPAVWSNEYLAVWHLAEAAENGQNSARHEDATGRGNEGAQSGNQGVDGPNPDIIGGAQFFDGNDDFIEIAQYGLQVTGTELTLLARVLVDEQREDFAFVLGSGARFDGMDAQWRIVRSRFLTAWNGQLRAGSDVAYATGPAAGLQVWYVLALVYDGDEVRLYIDGESMDTFPGNLSGNLAALAGSLYIGGNRQIDDVALDGMVDEVRIADTVRSPGWLRVQHASMSDTLLSFGAVECQDACP